MTEYFHIFNVLYNNISGDNHQRIAADVQAAMRNRQTVEQDEQWKRTNCRVCPHCGRVIQKNKGCDTMRCGYDTDGGPIAGHPGCGRGFKWSTAEPYSSPGGDGAAHVPGASTVRSAFTELRPEQSEMWTRKHVADLTPEGTPIYIKCNLPLSTRNLLDSTSLTNTYCTTYYL